MPARTAALAIAAVALAAPAAAVADVPVRVPAAFLGGPIAAPAAATADAAAGPAGRPSRPRRAVADRCADAAPEDCAVWGDEATTDILPEPPPDIEEPPVDPDTGRPVPVTGDAQALEAVRAAPVAPPAPGEIAALAGGLLAPRPADWLPWQTPVLRWRPSAGATHYNVQVFRGGRRVLNAWPARARMRVPVGVLEQGRVYVWAVWPGTGPRRMGRYGAQTGRSSFQVTLRPRLVMRRAARGTVAEIRPHVPYGVLRLTAPPGLRARIPATVVIGRDGRVALPVRPRQAERLRATLIGRGPAPPVGLRG